MTGDLLCVVADKACSLTLHTTRAGVPRKPCINTILRFGIRWSEAGMRWEVGGDRGVQLRRSSEEQL